jgi:hypothetical protein
MDRKAPLPSLATQKPTWAKTADLARAWGLDQLAKRVNETSNRNPFKLVSAENVTRTVPSSDVSVPSRYRVMLVRDAPVSVDLAQPYR